MNIQIEFAIPSLGSTICQSCWCAQELATIAHPTQKK